MNLKNPTLSAQECRVNPILSPEDAMDQATIDTCGPKPLTLFAVLDQTGLSWKMLEGCLPQKKGKSSGESYQTWPPSGIMQNGKCFRREPLVRLTRGIGSLSLPTPSARDYRDLSLKEAYAASRNRHQPSLATEVLLAGLGGLRISQIYEWAMGFPYGWLDIE